MSADVNLLGVMVPSLFPISIAAFLIMALIRRLLGRYDLYRFIWHPPLFDTALFVSLAASLDLLRGGVAL